MKIMRHAKILEIISSKDIETQEELAEELKKNEVDVTQATVSRDIKELKLIKILAPSGRYKYAASLPIDNFLSSKLVSIFHSTVLNVEQLESFIIVKTISGSASAAAESIDCLNFEGIAGTIAGDNTILILVRGKEKAEEIAQKMKKMLSE